MQVACTNSQDGSMQVACTNSQDGSMQVACINSQDGSMQAACTNSQDGSMQQTALQALYTFIDATIEDNSHYINMLVFKKPKGFSKVSKPLT